MPFRSTDRTNLLGGSALALLLALLLAACAPKEASADLTLNVDLQGDGAGSVTVAPDGGTAVTFDTDDSRDYAEGTRVTLSASPAAGSLFGGWRVDGSATACAGQGACTVTLDDNTSVVAVFARDDTDPGDPTLTLDLQGDGAGSVVVTPDGGSAATFTSDAARRYPDGTALSLEATPSSGSTFGGWTVNGSATPCPDDGACRLTLDTDATVAATFLSAGVDTAVLTVTFAGGGPGRVILTPDEGSAVTCDESAPCSAEFPDGTVVALSAEVGEHSRFNGFTGGPCAGGATCQVALTGSTGVTASFTAIDPELPEGPDGGTLPPPDYGDGPVSGADGVWSALSGVDLSSAASAGAWSPVAEWPLIALHVILMPDGRVLNYGTDERGQQGSQFIYDVWDPEGGLALGSHLTLENTTPTDIFCSAQVIVPGTGKILISGGDVTVDGVRNYGSPDVNVFDPNANTLTPSPLQLMAGRWYPTMTTLSNGEILIQGGRDITNASVTTPELYTLAGSWKILDGARSGAAYGGGNYYYPWAFLIPDGRVLNVGSREEMFFVDPTGDGDVESAGARDALVRRSGSAAMFDTGKILVIGGGKSATKTAVVIDARPSVMAGNGGKPKVTSAKAMKYARTETNLTTLPDGTVLASGGSAERNELVGVAYRPEIWNPATNVWTEMAPSYLSNPDDKRARLYHSTALLLPSGAVLNAGGGSTGPQTNLNAQVFFPPYLFDDDGSLADRPSYTLADPEIAYGSTFSLTPGAGPSIERVTLVRNGSATHGFDMEQRFVELDVAAGAGGTLAVSAPANGKLAPPGYYMLFALDAAGVPSEARIVKLD